MTNLMLYAGPVIGVAVTVVSLIFVLRVFGNLARSNKEHARLLQVGHRAAGQVASAQQTGTHVNNNPQIALHINVTPPGGAPYPVQMNKIVSMLEIPQYQVGAHLDVRIDPANPNNIAIAGPLQPPMGMGAPGGTDTPRAEGISGTGFTSFGDAGMGVGEFMFPWGIAVTPRPWDDGL